MTDRVIPQQYLRYFAFVEIAVSCLLYIAIAYYSGRTGHILIASAVAFILLLRTEKSARFGLQLYRKLLPYVYPTLPDVRKSEIIETFAWLRVHCATAILSMCIRIYATAVVFLKHPSDSIHCIKKNWLSQCFEVSFFTPYEPVPGAGAYPSVDNSHSVSVSEQKDPRIRLLFDVIGWVSLVILSVLFLVIIFIISYFVGELYGELYGMTGGRGGHLLSPESRALLKRDLPEKAHMIGLVIGVIFVICTLSLLGPALQKLSTKISVIPAALYRITLKATFIVWCPLLLSLSPLFDKEANAREKLDAIRNGVVSKVIFAISVLLLLRWFIYAYGAAQARVFLPPIFQELYLNHLPFMNLITLTTCCLVIYSFIQAESTIRKIDNRPDYSALPVIESLSRIALARLYLSTYMVLNSIVLLIGNPTIIEFFFSLRISLFPL